mmetsp:Transcript_113286/g.199987  ORF Transcript_113286/g.199987 Transcript_113286/m.199987 type:complete len:148 (+) Transcript_113286:2-445(+)
MGWLPDHVWRAQKKGGSKGGGSWNSGGGSKGGGGWKSGGGGGGWKSGGGGQHWKGGASAKRPKSGFKVVKENAECTVWMGGIPEGTSYQEIQQAFAAAGTCKKVHIGSKGTGFAWFTTPQEAQTCIAMFNGTQVGESFLQLDSYTKK